jgi:hypothetical protein
MSTKEEDKDSKESKEPDYEDGKDKDQRSRGKATDSVNEFKKIRYHQ